MARRKKQTLYEVISKTSPKSGYGRAAEPAQTEMPDSGGAAPEAKVHWPRRPRIVQFNAATGRLEMSIPYQLAIALLLGLILMVLIAFRLGQAGGAESGQNITAPAMERTAQEHQIGSNDTRSAGVTRTAKAADAGKKTGAVVSTGDDHVIVLVEYKIKADLVPVQKHFARYGIETRIVSEAGQYFLITKDTYQNPGKQGTDGYKMRQRIIEAGAKYKNKAPVGYETFAPHYFSDAYGRKFK